MIENIYDAQGNKVSKIDYDFQGQKTGEVSYHKDGGYTKQHFNTKGRVIQTEKYNAQQAEIMALAEAKGLTANSMIALKNVLKKHPNFHKDQALEGIVSSIVVSGNKLTKEQARLIEKVAVDSYSGLNNSQKNMLIRDIIIFKPQNKQTGKFEGSLSEHQVKLDQVLIRMGERLTGEQRGLILNKITNGSISTPVGVEQAVAGYLS